MHVHTVKLTFKIMKSFTQLFTRVASTVKVDLYFLIILLIALKLLERKKTFKTMRKEYASFAAKGLKLLKTEFFMNHDAESVYIVANNLPLLLKLRIMRTHVMHEKNYQMR